MKRKLLTPLPRIKAGLVAVPAAALMLGAAQAGTTVGLNFQAYYYDSGTTPQTVGYGAGYQTTGFPVTTKAFGVATPDWTSTDPLNCQGLISGSVNFGGTLIAQIDAPNAWQSGIGALNAGWVPQTVAPGEDEATWGYLDDGNSNGSRPTATVYNLAAKFPNGYVIQTIAANGGLGKTFNDVDITDGVTTNTVVYNAYDVPNENGYDGTVGLTAQSAAFTSDVIQILCQPKTSGKRSVLAGFIITDQPVVTKKPVGGTYNSGQTVSLSADVIGLPTGLAYQWRLNGTNIPGANSLAYSKVGATIDDAGDYDLVASNAYGSGTSSVASVTIQLSPTITTDVPAAVTNFASLSASFSVVAGGAEPLTYQWQHDGADLPGANAANLLLDNLEGADAGDYRLIITNAIGAVTSSVVNLTVVSGLPYEGFNYADGDIAGQNGGTGWADAWSQGTWTGGNYVMSPGSGYQDVANNLTTTGGALFTGFSGAADFGSDRTLAASVGGAGTVYISFVGGFTNGGWQGVDLMNGDTRVMFLGQGWSLDYWGCGSFPYPEVKTTKPSTVESFVVYRFDFTPTNAAVRIYVDPTLATEPASADATGTLSLFQFNKLRVKAHAYNAGVFDELRIGGTWSTVTPATPRNDPPVLVKDLTGATINAYAGATANLSIEADGAPTLHYKWVKNGSIPVGGDTSTLTLSAVTVADNGDYSVTVTNSWGSTNSLTSHLTVLATPDLYTDTAVQDTPVGYWPLREMVLGTAYDYSGSGHDGVHNGGLVPGVSGPRPPEYKGFSAGSTAYEFDGASSFVDFGNAPALSGPTDFTVEMWVNTTNGAGRLISQRDSTSAGYQGQYVLGLSGGAPIFFCYRDGYQFNLTSPKLVNDGKWHHIAGVRSGTNGIIYVDGTVVAQGSSSTVLKIMNPDLIVSIGRDSRDLNNYYQGRICDAAVYDYALAPDRIGQHAYTGLLATDPIVLGTAPGGFIEDSKPSGTPHHGVNKGAGWAASVLDIYGTNRMGVATFASSQIVIPPDADFNAANGTLCFWMKAAAPLPGPGNEAAMLFDRRAGAGTVVVLSDLGGIKVQCYGGANTFEAGYLPDDTWHHVAITYNQSAGGSVEIFVDGNSYGSQQNTSAWSWPTNQQIELGKSHDTYWKRYNGQLDDLRIYNRVLTQPEIASIVAGDALVDAGALKVRFNFGTAAGVGTSLTWPLGTLESTPSLTTPSWTPVSGALSPYPWLQPPPAQPTNPSAFYRIRL